ncbi:MAG: 3-hydroxyacyl-CoA dehydrogenase family protein [Bacteroidales bacterium]|nr:3-hydroxyacyl-CoA dehydrogenase family protein [Bacteroidales bacterium]
MHKIKNIAVVGEGKMGSSIFHYLIDFDFRLTWLCSSDAAREKAQNAIIKKTKRLLQSGVLTEAGYASKLEQIQVTSDAIDLKYCDLVIEAITENADEKIKLFKQLDEIVDISCLLTTNSSSLVPSLLIPSENRKDKVTGLHFFFPVPMKSTVELITGPSTSQQTKESLHGFLLEVNKKPFLQDESNAFILNRLLLDFQAEAFHILEEGEFSHADIDDCVRQHIFPTGVFEFFDHVGIDIMLSAIKTYTQGETGKEFYRPMIIKLEEMVRQHRLGIKTRCGFYDYTNAVVTSSDDGRVLQDNSSLSHKVAEQLWNFFTCSVSSVIASGVCSRDELAGYVKDYLGVDTDPFTMASSY